MAEKEPIRPEVKQLRDKITPLIAIDWVTPALNPEFGALKFSDSVPVLMAGAELIKNLAKTDLGLLPQARINAISANLDRYGGTFNQIKNFDVRQPNSPANRDTIANQLREHYNQLYDNVAIPLGVWAATGVDIARIKDELSAELRGPTAENEKAYHAALAEIDNARKQALGTLEAVKKAAAEVGVTENAKVFESQAAEHLNSSQIWGAVTAVMAAVTVGWGAIALWGIPIPPGSGTSTIVQEAIAKLIVFSGLSYGLVWCARNYSANRHNYVLNKHRQNSLTTFETFVKAAGGDADIKNAVLLQATTAIFTAQSTGYSSKEPEVDNPTRLLEIVRSAKSAT